MSTLLFTTEKKLQGCLFGLQLETWKVLAMTWLLAEFESWLFTMVIAYCLLEIDIGYKLISCITCITFRILYTITYSLLCNIDYCGFTGLLFSTYLVLGTLRVKITLLTSLTKMT